MFGEKGEMWHREVASLPNVTERYVLTQMAVDNSVLAYPMEPEARVETVTLLHPVLFSTTVSKVTSFSQLTWCHVLTYKISVLTGSTKTCI